MVGIYRICFEDWFFAELAPTVSFGRGLAKGSAKQNMESVRLSECMLIPERRMELDSVLEEVVARGLINDEQPSLVGLCH